MRIALRNKDKISEKLGADLLNILLKLLKEYSEDHNHISIDSRFGIKSGETTYEFKAIKGMYDVVIVAYVGESKATP